MMFNVFVWDGFSGLTDFYGTVKRMVTDFYGIVKRIVTDFYGTVKG